MTGYDLIGDIHGYADELEALLQKMDYREIGDVYRHNNRKAIFIGDLIDRGPKQRRVLEIVQKMVGDGGAKIVMGNHEYNAVCFHTVDSSGAPLRAHTEKNIGQHAAFLEEFPFGEEETKQVIDWFKTLPIALDLDGVRVVHACWSDQHIDCLHQGHHGAMYLDEQSLLSSSEKGTDLYDVVEALLKGIEVELPSHHSFLDKDNNERRSIRIEWWNQNARTYREYSALYDEVKQNIPDVPITQSHSVSDNDHRSPVFFGHYWMRGEPSILTDQAVCLDYSIAASRGERKLVAYRWNPKSAIEESNFVSVKRYNP